MKLFWIILALTGLLVTAQSCFEVPIDTSKATVTFKHTIKLPGGFSIESSAPLDLNKLNQVGEANPQTIYEKEKFSIPIEIKNDNQRHKNTKIQFKYSQNTIEYLYVYAADGTPLSSLGGGYYTFDTDVLPQVPTPLYVAGQTKQIPDDYPYVAMDFELSYLEENGSILASKVHRIQVYNINYTISSNISDDHK